MDSRQYALAVRLGDQLKARIDEVLRQMDEAGELDQLRHKWWIEKSECSGAVASLVAAGSLGIALLAFLTSAVFPQL